MQAHFWIVCGDSGDVVVLLQVELQDPHEDSEMPFQNQNTESEWHFCQLDTAL